MIVLILQKENHMHEDILSQKEVNCFYDALDIPNNLDGIKKDKIILMVYLHKTQFLMYLKY